MELQFTPYAFVNALAGIISLIIAFAIWRRRPGPGVNAFVLMMVAVALWTIGSALEISSMTLNAKIFFLRLIYLGVVIVPTSWVLFALEYTGKDQWINRRTLILFAAFPALTMFVILTNGWHFQFWQQYETEIIDGLVQTNFGFDTLFWVHTAYSYLMLFVGAVILIRAVVSSPQLYRGQIGLILIGAIMPFVGNILFLSQLNPFPEYVDFTATAFVATGIPIGWALYRFRLMDIVPVARATVFDNMVDGVLVVDSETRIVDINDAAIRILGLKDSGVVGKSLVEVWSKQRDLLLQFRDVKRINTEVELDVGGESRIFNVRVSALKNRHDEITGRIATLTDITTLKQINRELVIARQKADEATRLKSEFLATMSHELRTPLGAVIGYSELMLTGMVGELADKHHEYTDRIHSNAQYLLRLINDILDISKIEAGRMELALQPFEVKHWVDNIVKQHEVLASEKGLDFQVEIDPKLPQTLIGDSARLRQVVINLLSNAFKFTREGQVKFEVNQNDKTTWKIEVSDTGIGIPPHKQETIFEEFHQVDGSSTREFGGTGLGLAIVRRFVLMMGGTIRLNSTLDAGSTFTIILPVLSEIPEQVSMVSGEKA